MLSLGVKDTIYALSSAPGLSAVSVIRISGNKSSEILKCAVGFLPKPYIAKPYYIRNHLTNSLIDQSLVIWFPQPRSFTGEDSAEIHIHGSKAVLVALFKYLESFDEVRQSQPGEFIKRAFLNNKLDLSKVEGIHSLLAAETETQLNQALNNASGSFSRQCRIWKEQMIEALSYLESEIDFSDEDDISPFVYLKADPLVERLRDKLISQLSDQKSLSLINSGFKVALVGPPNSGKSSIINWLSMSDVAIVSDIPGTTRDVVKARMEICGYLVIVSDTAGIRETYDIIENKGVELTYKAISDADMVLWITSPDNNYALPNKLSKNHITVLNKSDMKGRSLPDNKFDIELSVKFNHGRHLLIKAITNYLKQYSDHKEDTWLLNDRQQQEIKVCVQALDEYIMNKEKGIEIAAEHLRLGITALSNVTGYMDNEEVLDEIFSKFCIGK